MFSINSHDSVTGSTGGATVVASTNSVGGGCSAGGCSGTGCDSGGGCSAGGCSPSPSARIEVEITVHWKTIRI